MQPSLAFQRRGSGVILRESCRLWSLHMNSCAATVRWKRKDRRISLYVQNSWEHVVHYICIEVYSCGSYCIAGYFVDIKIFKFFS